MDDSDWAVYREIVSLRPYLKKTTLLIPRQGGEDESEAEEEDQSLLQSLETRLLQYDPTFTEDDTLQGRADAKHALIHAFVRGGLDTLAESNSNEGSGVTTPASRAKYDPDDPRQTHQLHLNVERIRVPETWFQPGMFGVDSAGVGELAGWILNGFDDEERRRMMQVRLPSLPCS